MNPVEEALNQALQSDPENWELRFELLQKMRARGATQEAGDLLEAATVVPEDEAGLQRLVTECAALGKLPLAEAHLQGFLGANPESALGHYLLAKTAAKLGQLQEARTYYDRAVALDGEMADATLAAKLADLGQTMAHSPEPVSVAAAPPAPTMVSPVKGLTPPPPVSVPVAPAAPSVAPLTPPPSVKGIPAPVTTSVPPPAPVAAAAVVEEPAHELIDTGSRHLVLAEGLDRIEVMEGGKTTNQKLIAVTVAVLAHVVILGAFALVVMSLPQANPPQIVTTAAPVLDEDNMQKQEIEKQVQRKPVQSAQNQMSVMSVTGASAVSLPDITTDLTSFDPIGMGDAFGSSMTFDAGEDGGMVSFFGSKSVSKRVVFAVDYSGSMNGQKDALMRKELAKSLNALPGGIEYQCIFFHGPAWYHGEEVDTKGDKKDPFANYLVQHGREQIKWYMGFQDEDRKQFPNSGGDKRTAIFHPATGFDKPEKLPVGEYWSSTRTNIRKSIKIVEETPLAYGTDWRWPLYMAFNMEPDTIFFMTDGAFSARGSMLDELLDYNRKKSRAKINTICMMVPNAADQLAYLAEKTKGEFSLVLEDQTVVRGKELEDLLKKGRK